MQQLVVEVFVGFLGRRGLGDFVALGFGRWSSSGSDGSDVAVMLGPRVVWLAWLGLDKRLGSFGLTSTLGLGSGWIVDWAGFLFGFGFSA